LTRLFRLCSNVDYWNEGLSRNVALEDKLAFNASDLSHAGSARCSLIQCISQIQLGSSRHVSTRHAT